MILNIEENVIIIINNSKSLRPYQSIQLRNWGFKKDSENKYSNTEQENIPITLKKIINYFNTEDIEYKLSDSCSKVVSDINKSTEYYKEIKNKCRNFKDGVYDADEFNKFSEFISDNTKRKFKDHQIKAAYHLYISNNGANFSVPGSGKTSVVLGVYKKLKSEGYVNTLYVVGPPACFGPWQDEYEKNFSIKPSVTLLAGGDVDERKSEYYASNKIKNEIYLTTFHSLLNDQEDVVKFFNTRDINVFLVIDEGHYIKQLGGNWAKAALRISKFAKYRCILTGTPMPKNYSDMFNLFDFLWPENSPIDTYDKTIIKMREEGNDIEEIKNILQDKIGPLFYRVRKSELGLIKPDFHPPIMIKMNPNEKLLYDAIKNKIRSYAKDDYLQNIELINRLKRGRIIRLRQSVSYARLLATAVEGYSENIIGDKSDLADIICNYDRIETPAKIEYLIEFTKKMQENNQKMIIWANFIGTLELIIGKLKEAGFYCKLIYGKTPTENTSYSDEETREKIRNEFVDSESGLNILVANPAACAESISLHKTCFNALYYDLSYNCAQYLQSLDRIHRVGGSEINKANYYFLQYEDSIDQDIKNNLDNKASRMYDVIEEDYSVYSLDMFEDDDDIKAYERLFINTDND